MEFHFDILLPVGSTWIFASIGALVNWMSWRISSCSTELYFFLAITFGESNSSLTFPLVTRWGKKWTKKINLISQLYENSPNKSVDRKNNFLSTRTPKNNNDQKEPGKTPKITNNIKQIQGISVERKEFKKNPEKYQLKTKQRKQHTMLWLLNCWNDDVS